MEASKYKGNCCKTIVFTSLLPQMTAVFTLLPPPGLEAYLLPEIVRFW